MITGRHFQNAYLCDDIEAGIARFREHADIGAVPIYDIDQTLSTPDGARRMACRLAFVWIGDLQYELIQVIADETGIYANCASNGGPLRFHHICMRVEDWDAFRLKIEKQSLPWVIERAIEGDPLKFLYLDARSTFGHYLEYVWATDERWAAMRAM
jgi:Glyoxalase/Bleomycin resistance protein/Dioxygenase superfamily